MFSYRDHAAVQIVRNNNANMFKIPNWNLERFLYLDSFDKTPSYAIIASLFNESGEGHGAHLRPEDD